MCKSYLQVHKEHFLKYFPLRGNNSIVVTLCNQSQRISYAVPTKCVTHCIVFQWWYNTSFVRHCWKIKKCYLFKWPSLLFHKYIHGTHHSIFESETHLNTHTSHSQMPKNTGDQLTGRAAMGNAKVMRLRSTIMCLFYQIEQAADYLQSETHLKQTPQPMYHTIIP